MRNVAPQAAGSPPPAALFQDIILGRQPILDRRGNLAGYELLFRSANRDRAGVLDDARATATVINRAMADFGLEQVLGNVRGFVNFSADLLLGDIVEILPKDKIVIEILETVNPTPQIMERVRELRKMGFTIALDDFHGTGSLTEPFLPLADIVKVDLNGKAPEALLQLTLGLQNARKVLLAEKVDGRRQADDCWDLGYDLFQGFFFAKPTVLSGKKASAAEAAIMRLVALVATDASDEDIHEEIRANAQLAINLLRIVNSAAAGVQKPIKSLRHALLVVGRSQLNRWLQLLMYSMAGEGAGQYPGPLAILAATRGKLLERLTTSGERSNHETADRAFMVGVLSLAGVLLSRDLSEIIDPLPLSVEVKEALLGRTGPLGKMLDLAEALERADMDQVGRTLAQDLPGLSRPAVNENYFEAMAWGQSLATGNG